MKTDALRLAFVYPHPAENRKVYTGYHHGLGSLSAALKERFSHCHRLFRLNRLTVRETAEEMAGYRPDVILVTACSGQMKTVEGLLGALKHHGARPFVMVGGPHATAMPEETLGMEGVQAVCIGEGEKAVCEFVRSFDGRDYSRDVESLWFRGDEGQIKKNGLSVPLPPDEMPFADRDLFDFQDLISAMPPEVGPEFLGSRGCCFDCSYCESRLMHGASVRFRSPEKLIEEIKEVCGRFSGFRIIGFHDNIFTLNKNWLREFCERYAREVRLPYWCNTRIGCFTEEDITWLKKSGCRRIHMGIESGSARIRKEVLKRDLDETQIVEAFRMVRKHGIKTVAFNMIGLPTETEADLLETIRLNRLLSPSWIILSVFSPFPGTALYDCCKKSPGIQSGWADDFYSDDFVLEQRSISADRVRYYYKNFIPMVYG